MKVRELVKALINVDPDTEVLGVTEEGYVPVENVIACSWLLNPKWAVKQGQIYLDGGELAADKHFKYLLETENSEVYPAICFTF